MNKIKTIFIVIISILTINIAKAEEIQVYFYDEGATCESVTVKCVIYDELEPREND